MTYKISFESELQQSYQAYLLGYCPSQSLFKFLTEDQHDSMDKNHRNFEKEHPMALKLEYGY